MTARIPAQCRSCKRITRSSTAKLTRANASDLVNRVAPGDRELLRMLGLL